MTIRDRIVGPFRRLRRWFAARWMRLGMKPFPRPHDTILDAPPVGNVFRIVHLHDGLDEYVHTSTEFRTAIGEWARILADVQAYPGEVQFWKNGKCRDTRGAV